MYAYSNILAALIERGSTGRGARIDVSMLESMVEWMSYPLYYAYRRRRAAAARRRRPRDDLPVRPVPRRRRQDRDARRCRTSASGRVSASDVLGQPELATDERFASNSKRTRRRDALRAIIVAAFRPLTAAQVIERLDAAGIANARMNDMREVWAHPQLAARDRWVDVDTPAGRVPALAAAGLAASTAAAHGRGARARRSTRRDPARARL